MLDPARRDIHGGAHLHQSGLSHELLGATAWVSDPGDPQRVSCSNDR